MSIAVKSADPDNNDAKMKLAEIYEMLNEPRKALELVYEGEPPSRPYWLTLS
jgi:general transcription factor 3C polypeptide 3 (transcription factor C subunit 4)